VQSGWRRAGHAQPEPENSITSCHDV